jgi:fumarate reductase flavoprotein subunit
VLVVGAGLAGLTAAMTAADAGARALLIDKRYKVGGSAMGAGGSFSAAGSRMQKDKEIQDSPEQHYEDANRIGRGRADPAILRLYTQNAGPTQDWLQSLGVKFNPEGPRLAYEHELYSVARTCDAIDGGRGYIETLTRNLRRHVDEGRIRIRTETAAKELIEKDGRVTGLQVVDDEDKVSELYARAVILSCGGYGFNRSMIRQYNPSLAHALTIASKNSTGDGIRMAEAVGARLVNMDILVPYFAGVENPPSSGRTMFISLVSSIVPFFKGDVWVSQDAKRFMNEDSASPDERERALRKVPDAAVFVIFDEAMRKANKPPFVNFDEHLLEGRVIKKADSFPTLARAIGVPAETLVKTMTTYNSYVSAGRDADFNRKELVKIDQPPYYAIVASGVIFMTMGGIQTNTKLQALDGDGSAIPGLYAAGEVQGAGQWMGDGLMSGAGNGGAIVFGRLAAMAATRQRLG